VYYDLARARELNGIGDVAIVRVEQLSPFPFDLVKSAADTYPNAEVTRTRHDYIYLPPDMR
jgi:2-oxoglutarate dehydrogenase E1 component